MRLFLRRTSSKARSGPCRQLGKHGNLEKRVGRPTLALNESLLAAYERICTGDPGGRGNGRPACLPGASFPKPSPLLPGFTAPPLCPASLPGISKPIRCHGTTWEKQGDWESRDAGAPEAEYLLTNTLGLKKRPVLASTLIPGGVPFSIGCELDLTPPFLCRIPLHFPDKASPLRSL